MEFHAMRVLVVEDSFETMNLLNQMLNSMGIVNVFTAKDGREGLDFLGRAEDQVDVAICDWNMPKMNGLDLLRQIRTVDQHMPFLMVTGSSEQTKIIEAKSAGVTAYIVKPFSQEGLEKKLRVIHRMVATRAIAF